MNGYPYPQRPFQPANNGHSMMDLSADGISAFDLVDGQSLDDIVSQNEKASRRRSMPVYGGAQMAMGSPDSRRLSMMNFGDPGSNDMDDFRFDLSAGTGMDGVMRSGTFPRTTADMQNDRIPPRDLAINTQFPNQNPAFSNMADPASSYASPLHPNASLDMDMTTPYPNAMSMSMDMNDSLNMIPTDMNLFSNAQFATPMMDSPVNQDFVSPPPPPDPSPSMQPPDQFRSASSSTTPDVRSGVPTRAGSQEQSSVRSNSRPKSENQTSSNSVPTQMSSASLKAQEPIALPTGQNIAPEAFSPIKFPWTTPPGGFPSTMHSNPHVNTQFKNAYSSTGFDMLGVLVR